MAKKSNKLVMKYKLNKNRRLVGGSIKAKQFKKYKKKK